MQTRVDAELVFYSKRKSKARISDMQGTGWQAKSSQIQWLSYRQGLGRIRIEKQRVVLYNITIDWLTKNRHRIKIVLTARQTNRLEYLYTGILNILRGSWDVRRD